MMNTRNHRARAALPFALALIGAIGLSGCKTTNSVNPPIGGTPQPPRVQQQGFSQPRVGGRWLDVCFAHGACRERRAIDTFCRQQGFQRAVSRQVRAAPFGHQTVRIGDQSVCTNVAGNCHRVTFVTCQRTV
jgi:hypothetical protein